MIELKDVLSIHKILIDQFGGSLGIRDQGVLESALARPFGIFDGVSFYPSPEEKSAALIESIVKNHPFIDGNKRIGFVLMRLTLLNEGLGILATEEEKYQFVIDIASGKSDYESILRWIKKHAIK
jgi:death on curing protein